MYKINLAVLSSCEKVTNSYNTWSNSYIDIFFKFPVYNLNSGIW